VTRPSGPDGHMIGAILPTVWEREHEHGAGMTLASMSRRWKRKAPPWRAVGPRSAMSSATGCSRWARSWGQCGSIRRLQQRSKNVGCARCSMRFASIRAQSPRSTRCSFTGPAWCAHGGAGGAASRGAARPYAPAAGAGGDPGALQGLARPDDCGHAESLGRSYRDRAPWRAPSVACVRDQ
jgi:hypothetical protein